MLFVLDSERGGGVFRSFVVSVGGEGCCFFALVFFFGKKSGRVRRKNVLLLAKRYFFLGQMLTMKKRARGEGGDRGGRWGVGCSLLRGGGIREEADAALSEPFHPTPQSQQPRHTRDTCSFSHPPSTPLYTPPHRTQIPLPPPPEFPSPPKKNKMKKSRSP